MRRKDREVTDPERIREIIKSCDCCRIGLVDDGVPYIVPLSFGYVQEGEMGCFYFHGASQGRKLELSRQNGTAGFELEYPAMSFRRQIRPADTPASSRA